MNFSVLISIYHKECPLYFKEALDSVINQTLFPAEIILVKDGNLTKQLDSIIFNYTHQYPFLFKIVTLPQNVGLGNALRIGIENCSFEYVARMDTDDICDKERFNKQVQYLLNNPHVDACGMWIEEFNMSIGDFKSIRKVPVNHSDIVTFGRSRNPMNHVTVMFKKSKVLEAGNYQHFQSMEDYYLWWRMIQKKHVLANIPEVGVYVRIGNNMFDRRRGFEYFKNDFKFHKLMWQNEQLSLFELIYILLGKFLVRQLPVYGLKKVYKYFLR